MARKSSKNQAAGNETREQAASDSPLDDLPEGPDDDLDFETALEALEALVAQMETGDMSLEASLSAFERGVKLTRQCQTALRSAELKVKKLTENNELEALDLEELDDD